MAMNVITKQKNGGGRMTYLLALATLCSSLIAFLIAPSFAQATIIYATVSATGCSNPDTDYTPSSNTCGSGSARVHTGQSAVKNAIAEAASGDTVRIVAGTYNPGVVLDMVPPSGTSALAPTIIEKCPADVCTTVTGNVEIVWTDNVPTTDTSNRAFNMHGKSNVTIRGTVDTQDFIIRSNGPQGVCATTIEQPSCYSAGGQAYIATNSTNITIRNTEVGAGFNQAIFAGAGDSGTTGLTIANNNFHHIGKLANGTVICNVGTGPSLDGNSCHGIYYVGGTGAIFENNYFHDNAGYGIECVAEGASNCANTIIKGNRIKLNNGTGILLQNGTGAQVYNNLIDQNGQGSGGGFGILVNSTNAGIYNNTITRNVSVGVCVGDGFKGASITNNLVVLNDNGTSGQQINITDCRASAGGGTLLTNVTTGSLSSHFADAANDDFRLCTDLDVPHDNCPAASSAVGAGTNLQSLFTTDINLSTREAPWDIGAYKAGEATPGAPSPLLVIEIACDNTVTDSSGNANHGTLTNGATYNSSGKYNQACSFDGTNDYVSIANSSTIDQLTHAFTISLWVKMAAGATTLKYLANNDNKTYLGASSGSICGAGGVFGGFEQGGSNTNACHSTPLTTDWTHLAITYNSQTAQLILYKNGSPITTTSASTVLDAATGVFRIGSGVDEAFTAALIDEIRVYNYARNASQVITDRDTPINTLGVPASPFLSIGAAASAFKLGAGATVFKLQGAQ
jgi:hypothetical protein